MEAKANYTLVGFMVIILSVSLIVAMLWLSSGLEKKKYHTYAVYMRESVSGLSEDSVVKYNGVAVGRVKKIQLDENDPQRVRLLLSIEEGTPITTSTTATLISQGITGVTYIGLASSTSSLVILKKSPGQPYPVIPSRPSIFNQLDKALKEVTVNINRLSNDVRKVFTKENLDNVHDILKDIRTFTDVLAKNQDNLNSLLKNMSKITTKMEEGTKNFPKLMHDAQKTINHINEASIAASQTMSSGKVAINKISQQTLPPLVDLLQRLQTMTANLEQVSALMRQNPAVVVRGTTPPAKGPGE